MIIVLRQDITPKQKDDIKTLLKTNGLIVREIKGKEDTVLGAVGVNRMDPRQIELMDGVASVVPISKPYKLASRELKKEDTIVTVGGVKIGGNRVVMMAGPCAVESERQIMEIASLVREAGAVILRGGAFKPRTSPYSFQGLGEEGLKYLRKAGDEFGMPVTTEVVSPRDVAMMADYIDMFQIGARNMQNFELLKEVGKTGMPVLLKRGLAATIEEWLMAAEYLMANGTDQVVLCERGIRTYEKATRNTLDCSAVPVVQKLTHLPVIGDPSHATGMRDLVAPMGLALVAAGASGLIVEVHNHPDKALSDGPQSLLPEQFEKLVRDVQALCPVVGKSLESVPRIIPANMKDESAQGRAPRLRRGCEGHALQDVPRLVRGVEQGACEVRGASNREHAGRHDRGHHRPADALSEHHYSRRGAGTHHTQPHRQSRHQNGGHQEGLFPSPGACTVPRVPGARASPGRGDPVLRHRRRRLVREADGGQVHRRHRGGSCGRLQRHGGPQTGHRDQSEELHALLRAPGRPTPRTASPSPSPYRTSRERCSTHSRCSSGTG